MLEKDIETLKEKLKKIDDVELTSLVYKLIQYNSYLLQVSTTDAMTGLYNRRILDKNQKPSVVMLCDIDNFKLINDLYGHDKGDFVIQVIGKILKESFRSSDYVCRFGGDEFLILCNDSNYEFIKQRCVQINDAIEKAIHLSNHKVTLSIGVYVNCNDDSLDFAIKKADEALYISKNNGKNQVSVYNEINPMFFKK